MRWKGEWDWRVRGIESNAFASQAGERGSRGADAIGAKRIERDKKNVEMTPRFPACRQKKQPEHASGAAEDHGAILHDRSWLIWWDTNDSDRKSDLLKAITFGHRARACANHLKILRSRRLGAPSAPAAACMHAFSGTAARKKQSTPSDQHIQSNLRRYASLRV